MIPDDVPSVPRTPGHRFHKRLRRDCAACFREEAARAEADRELARRVFKAGQADLATLPATLNDVDRELERACSLPENLAPQERRAAVDRALRAWRATTRAVTQARAALAKARLRVQREAERTHWRAAS